VPGGCLNRSGNARLVAPRTGGPGLFMRRPHKAAWGSARRAMETEMAHTYTEFFYHLAWGTRLREPLLTVSVEPVAHDYIRARCKDVGVFVYALDGMPDHVHLVCDIPPRLAVADVVKTLKGASSHFINSCPEPIGVLSWQQGYGGLTFARHDLKRVVAYVENQKRHHSASTLWHSLEGLGDQVPGSG
jgi:putative transposase